jgi:hypothetical protein
MKAATALGGRVTCRQSRHERGTGAFALRHRQPLFDAGAVAWDHPWMPPRRRKQGQSHSRGEIAFAPVIPEHDWGDLGGRVSELLSDTLVGDGSGLRRHRR